MLRRMARAMRSKAAAISGVEGGAWPGVGRGGGLGVEGAGEVGGHADDVVEDLAVVLRVLGLLAGVGGWVGVGWVGGHEQKKNIVGVKVSRVV